MFGYGSSSEGSGTYSDVLMSANQTVFTPEKCSASYQGCIYEDMFCAADEALLSGPCGVRDSTSEYISWSN